MYTPHTHCRACGYGKSTTPPGIKCDCAPGKLVKVFDLGLQPPPNDFCKEGEERAGFAPLEVLRCPRCGLAQLSVVVRPEILYSNYKYVTSRSATMKNHFAELWRFIAGRNAADRVVEIGSNDGEFLRFCLEQGVYRAVGIDPAENLADAARQGGVRSICGTFNRMSARESVMAAGCEADLIVARHVFCHIDDWDEFMRCLDVVASADATVAIEVPYVGDLLKNTEFDTIYHEHLSYLSLRALVALVERSAFKLRDAQRFPIHGGSLVVTLQRKGEIGNSLLDMLQAEDISEFSWRSFSDRVEANTAELKTFLRASRCSGFRVCGFGASAKSTVWINACKFTQDDIAFICDSTKGKWGCFTPGTNIPIADEGALLRELPNYAVLFAWNFKDEILANNARWIEKGGRFVIPVPKLEILTDE